LNDTPFSNETTIREHIDAGVSLSDAVNFLVEKYGLVRIDQKGFSWQEQPPLYFHSGYSASKALYRLAKN